MTGRGGFPNCDPLLRPEIGVYMPLGPVYLVRGLYPPVVVDLRFVDLRVPIAATLHVPSLVLVDRTEYPEE